MLLLLLACSDYELSPDVDVHEGEVSCEAWPQPADYAVDADSECLADPDVGNFEPIVEWRWSGHPDHASFTNVVSTPVVGNLHDDDGDGVLGEGDQPDLIFVAFYDKKQKEEGVLFAVTGDGQGTHWARTADIFGNAGLALGDLNGDGFPEVCASSMTHSVVCLNQFGQELWRAGEEPAFNGHPAIADLDADGSPEVIYGREVFRADGTLMWRGSGGLGGRGTNTHASIPVDLDGDGQLEVVAGNTVYDTDGSVVWDDGGEDGYPAIGNFDDDDAPEIVRVSYGQLILSDTDGSPLWTTVIDEEGARGGPPTVADFDGDGQAEVGVAGFSTYTVIDTDGTVLWVAPTEDDSSSVTGSSVFDFEGDGQAEVVYADEETLWVYDGATGAVLLEMHDHASNTRLEYPVIADLDGDGATEIILGSANAWWEGWNGITVIGDADDSWAPARPIWNQHAYSITNVDAYGGIPSEAKPNWLTWNNFRAAGTELGPSHWLPDLVPGEVEVCTETCWGGSVSAWLPVENRGLITATDVTIELGGQRLELGDIGPGEVAFAGPVELTEDTWGLGARLDPDNNLNECREDNGADLGPWPCD